MLRPATPILDGEVGIFDQQLVSRVEWLRGQPKGETATPARYMVFDCLSAGHPRAFGHFSAASGTIPAHGGQAPFILPPFRVVAVWHL